MKEALVVATIILQLIAAGETIITTLPTDTIVCYGGQATFHCGSDRDDIALIQWHITPDDLSLQERRISINTNITSEYATSTLSIIGLPVNDGIHIVCTAVTSSFDSDTVSALLTVSDIPPVEDLSIEFYDTVMNVTWNEPFCLPVYYTYSITITDDNNQTRTNNTTDPLYTMPLWSPCPTNYTVSVTVVGTGYTHKRSVPSNQTSGMKELIVDINYKNEIVKFLDVNMSEVNVVFKVVNVTSEVLQQCVNNDSFNFASAQLINGSLMIDSDTGTGTYTSGPYNERLFDILLVDPKTNLGDGFRVNISTYNVQNFFVEDQHNGTVKMTCIFAVNSSASGCYVVIKSHEPHLKDKPVNIYKNDQNVMNATNDTFLEDGMYSFEVFDVLNGKPDTNKPAHNAISSISSTGSLVTSSTIIQSVISSTGTSYKATSMLSSMHPSSPITYPTKETSFPISTVVIAIASCVVVCVIIGLIVFVYCYTTHKKQKKKEYDLRLEQREVEYHNTKANEYMSSELVPRPPATAVSTTQLQQTEGGDYHEFRTEFLPNGARNMESHYNISAHILARTSAGNNRMQQVGNHSIQFTDSVADPSNDSAISSNVISTSSDEQSDQLVEPDTVKKDLSQHIYSNTKYTRDSGYSAGESSSEHTFTTSPAISTLSSESTSHYADVPPTHQITAGEQQFMSHMLAQSTTVNHTVPAGPKLDESKYVKVVSNPQGPSPQMSYPPPEYSTIMHTSMSPQSPEIEETTTAQETSQSTNGERIGLPANHNPYKGKIVVGSNTVLTINEEEYSPDDATVAVNENIQQEVFPVHQTIAEEADDGGRHIMLTSSHPNPTCTHTSLLSFTSCLKQMRQQLLSYFREDLLVDDTIFSSTDIRDGDVNERYSYADISHSQMAYSLNDRVVCHKSGSTLVFGRSSTCVVLEEAVENCDVEDQVYLCTNYSTENDDHQEEKRRDNSTFFEVPLITQVMMSVVTLTYLIRNCFFLLGCVFDGGGEKAYVKNILQLVFDGGGVLPHTWSYTYKKFLCDDEFEADWLFLFIFLCNYMYLLCLCKYKFVFISYCKPPYSSNISSVFMFLKIFKKRKKKGRRWKPQTRDHNRNLC